jgi:hypothetical protein
MRLLFGRLVLMTGQQLRHLIGAAIHRPTRSPENVDGQEAAVMRPSWRSRPADSATIVSANPQPSPFSHSELTPTGSRAYASRWDAFRPARIWRTGMSRVGGKAPSNEDARAAVDDARCASTPSNRAALKAA